jgi:hypothetical protein
MYIHIIHVNHAYAVFHRFVFIFMYKNPTPSTNPNPNTNTNTNSNPSTIMHMLSFLFCLHYLCLIGRAYVFYVGHVDKSSLYETFFHCNILSKYHHHHHMLVLHRFVGHAMSNMDACMYIYMCVYIHIFINSYKTYI